MPVLDQVTKSGNCVKVAVEVGLRVVVVVFVVVLVLLPFVTFFVGILINGVTVVFRIYCGSVAMCC